MIATSPQTDKWDIILLSNSQIVTKIFIGTPKQQFTVLIDTSSMFLCLFDKAATGIPYSTIKPFDYSASSTFTPKDIEKSVDYISSSIIIDVVKDNVLIGNSQVEALSFGLIKDAQNLQSKLPPEVDGILGLGYNYEDIPDAIKFSLLYQLEFQGIIPLNLFKIEYTTKLAGIMSIGANTDYDTLHKWGVCSVTRTGVDPDYARWVCDGTFIEVGEAGKGGDNLILINDDSTAFKFIFDTSIDIVLLPEEMFKTITKKAFESFPLSDCNTIETLINYEIVCKSTIIKSQLEPINFAFPGNHIIVVDSRNAFYERANDITKEKEYVFIMKYLKESNPNNNLIIIGQLMLKYFSMIYSKNNEKIYFFSNEFYKSLSINFWVLMVVGIVAMSLGVILLIAWVLFKFIVSKTKIIIPEKEILRLSNHHAGFSIIDEDGEIIAEYDDNIKENEENKEEGDYNNQVEENNNSRDEYILHDSSAA